MYANKRSNTWSSPYSICNAIASWNNIRSTRNVESLAHQQVCAHSWRQLEWGFEKRGMERALPEGAWVTAVDGWMAWHVGGMAGMAWHGDPVALGGGRTATATEGRLTWRTVRRWEGIDAKVASHPGPGRVCCTWALCVGSVLNFTRSIATLQRLDSCDAVNTFGLSNVRALVSD